MQYGYIKPSDPKTGALRSEEYVKKAIRAFQKMAGINQTGKIDEETQQMMEMPRCGNKDNIQLGNGARRKRYALQGSKWAKRELSFRISAYPDDLAQMEVDDEIKRALQMWGDVTPLKFAQQSYGDPDLDVRFVRRSHGDGNPFDGRGRTLAHAFFPQWGGDAHFDEEEAWTIAKSSGVNLFQVAAHEFGHSLGLSHSDTSAALMAPFYRGFQRDFQLDDDDIRAIQELYGPPRANDKTTTPFPSRRTTRGPKVSVPPICRSPSVDAIVMNADGKTYIFKGTEYYRLNDYGIDEGYPRSIAEDWNLSGPIDCALHWDNGYTFIFKGDYYWKFYNQNLIYARKLSEGFKGVPNDLDAAFVWGGNGKTYFIKGNQYWRYSENSVDRGYPRPLSVWSGLPGRVDAAIKWRNGRTYFFSGSQYYRYNDRQFDIDTSYPRKIGNWWLGCPEEKKLGQISDGQSGSQMDGKGSDVTGTHSVADDKNDQYLSVDNTTPGLNSDASANGSSRPMCFHCSLFITSVYLLSSLFLQHTFCS
ncbi:matrix metalloproteinase-16-like [Littorina saxatilis]